MKSAAGVPWKAGGWVDGGGCEGPAPRAGRAGRCKSQRSVELTQAMRTDPKARDPSHASENMYI